MLTFNYYYLNILITVIYYLKQVKALHIKEGLINIYNI